MIDTATEELIPIPVVPDRIRLANRERINCSTVYRWTKSGCRGVVLETVQIGGRRATSARALQLFFEELSRTDGSGEEPSAPRTVTQRQRRSEAAAKELERLGA
jgi:hypothetical protein